MCIQVFLCDLMGCDLLCDIIPATAASDDWLRAARLVV